jgi:hypothetical protein
LDITLITILKGSALVQNRAFKHKLFVLNKELWSGNNGLELVEVTNFGEFCGLIFLFF